MMMMMGLFETAALDGRGQMFLLGYSRTGSEGLLVVCAYYVVLNE